MEGKNIFKLISRLLIAFGVLVINLALFTALANLICQKVYFVDIASFLGDQHTETPAPDEMSAIRLFFAIYSIGTFIVSAFILSVIFRRNPVEYLRLNVFPKPVFLIIIPLLFIVFIPFLSWAIQINSTLVLPDFLHLAEQKLKAMEDKNNRLYELLLGMNNYSDLFINLIVMALIPAIGEELFCRGVLLNVFYDYSRNFLRSVVYVAIIFTFLHMQFYKIFPMMILAILLGLLIIWTQSIWASILFHCLNNSIAVLGSFYYQRGVKNVFTDEKYQLPALLIILSLAVSIFLIFRIHKYSIKNQPILTHE